MFELTVTVAEIYLPAVMAAEKKYPSKKRQLNKLAAFFSYAVATSGDMTPALAQSLLDDLSTDGHKLHSSKIINSAPGFSPTSRSTAPTSPSPPSTTSTARNHKYKILESSLN